MQLYLKAKKRQLAMQLRKQKMNRIGGGTIGRLKEMTASNVVKETENESYWGGVTIGRLT